MLLVLFTFIYYNVLNDYDAYVETLNNVVNLKGTTAQHFQTGNK